MKKIGTMILGALLFSSAAAMAQEDVNAHGFTMVPSDGDLMDPLSTWRAKRPEEGTGGFNTLFEYAYRPLTLHERVGNREFEAVLVDHITALNLGGIFVGHERFSLALTAPVYLGVEENGFQSGAGVGNMRLSSPIGLILPNSDSSFGFGLAVVPHAVIPGAIGDHVYVANTDGFAGGFTAAVSLTDSKRWDVSTNLGVEFNPETELFNLRGREKLVTRVSGSYLLTDELAVRGEWLFRPSLRNNEFRGTESPMELQASLKGHTGRFVGWTVGAAKSLNKGASAAVWRGFAGVDLSFGKRDRHECVDCEPEVVVVNVEPEPCPPCTDVVCFEDGELAVLKPILFDYDKDSIRMPDSHEVMTSLVETLKAHPEILKLQVATGTDSRGSAEYNMDLSARRAKSVVSFLIENGIEKERLTSVGFGETRLLVENCSTEACHETNRYSLFTVLEVATQE